MSKPMKSFYEATRYLGQYVGKQVPDLSETACMSIQRRKQYAILKFLQNLSSEKKIFDEILIPLIQQLGYAEWLRDTVTDMALKKGLKSEDESFEEEITDIIIKDEETDNP